MTPEQFALKSQLDETRRELSGLTGGWSWHRHLSAAQMRAIIRIIKEVP